MTDSAQAGSVQPDPAAAGTPATPQVDAENGSAAPPALDPFSGLSEGTRKWVETKGYKSPEDLATAGMSAEQKLGSAIFLPKEDAPPEEWDKVMSKLPEAMRPPESPEKYEFKRTEGLPPDLPWDSEAETAFKQWAFEDKLTMKQAQGQIDKFALFQAERAKAQVVALSQSVEAAHDELAKDWGPPTEAKFKENVQIVNRVARKFDVYEDLVQGGILVPDKDAPQGGSVAKPKLVRLLLEVGNTDGIGVREGTIDTEGGAPAGENPFRRGADGRVNPDKITALINEIGPERAKQMCIAAGEPTTNWFSENPR